MGRQGPFVTDSPAGGAHAFIEAPVPCPWRRATQRKRSFHDECRRKPPQAVCGKQYPAAEAATAYCGPDTQGRTGGRNSGVRVPLLRLSVVAPIPRMSATAAVTAASVSRVSASLVQNRSSCRCSAAAAAGSPGMPPVLTVPGSILTWTALSEVAPGPQNDSRTVEPAVVRPTLSGTKSRASAAAMPPARTAIPQMRMISRATGRTIASLNGYALETITAPSMFPTGTQDCPQASSRPVQTTAHDQRQNRPELGQERALPNPVRR